MNILKQKASQIILVQHNQIPFLQLLNAKNVQDFITKFKFTGGNPVQDANGTIQGLAFNIGLLDTGSGQEVPIVQIVIEVRRMILEIEGSSSDLAILFGQIRDFLREIAKSDEEDFLEPIVVSNDSEIIVHLEFAFDRLINPKLHDFVRDDILSEAAQQFEQLAETSLDAVNLNFQIHYRAKDNSLNERRISLSRKEFFIQSAIGYPLSDCNYYSKAPMDSETHIQTLQKLEELMAVKE
jgi:hypothetical protein